MSKRTRAVHDSTAYLLHATAWRETSLVIQVFSREHGCVAMVAKGAKRPYSVLRPVLSAFQPLALSWTGAADVKVLTRAEVAGMRALTGSALMSGWYMNELLLRFLPREDAHPLLFDAYDLALQLLGSGARAAGALRRFEWALLRETGYGLSGDVPDFDDVSAEPALRKLLREKLNEQLVGRPLSTRRVLMEFQSRFVDRGPTPAPASDATTSDAAPSDLVASDAITSDAVESGATTSNSELAKSVAQQPQSTLASRSQPTSPPKQDT